MNSQYEDIIHLPRPVSAKHSRMPVAKRAAQFMPFAALTGYYDAIAETERMTEERIVLDENAIAVINRKLLILKDNIAQHPEAAVTYFQADRTKEGGAYVTATGNVKKIDDYKGRVVLMNGEEIAIQDILEIESGLFTD